MKAGSFFLALPAAALLALAPPALADLWPQGQPIPNAMAVRLNDSGLDLIEPSLEGMVSSDLILAALIAANPIFDEGDSFTSATVYVTDLEFDEPVNVGLDAHAGRLSLTANINNIVIYVDAEGTLVWIPWSSDGTIWANQAHLTADVQVDVTEPDHVIDVQITGADCVLSGFGFDIYGFPDILEGLFFDTVQETIESTIETQLPAQVEPAIETLLNGLPTEYSLELLGMVLTVQMEPQEILLNEQGLTVWLAGDAAGEDRSACVPTLSGSNYDPAVRPTYGTTIPGTQIAFDAAAVLSENFVNRLLFGAYDSGLMCLSLDAATLAELGVPIPLTSAIFEAAVPRIADYVHNAPAILAVRPQQPPTVELNPPGSPFMGTMEILALDLDVYFLMWDRWVRFFALEVDITGMALDVSVVEGGLLHIELGEPQIANAVIFDEILHLTDQERANLELVLPMVLEIVMPLLADSITDIALPAFEGFTMVIESLRVHGSNDSYLGAFGTVEPEISLAPPGLRAPLVRPGPRTAEPGR